MKCWQHKSAQTTRLGSQPCGAQPSSRASVGPPKIDIPQQERVQNQTSFGPVFSPFSVFLFVVFIFSHVCPFFFSFLFTLILIFLFFFGLLHFISISLFFSHFLPLRQTARRWTGPPKISHFSISRHNFRSFSSFQGYCGRGLRHGRSFFVVPKNRASKSEVRLRSSN